MAARYNKWTLEEKKRLADLLEVFPIHAYQAIAKRMDRKSEEEVQTYIEKMKYSATLHNNSKPVIPKETRAPLEEWLEICSGLVELEQFDTSSHLSKVMSIIAHFEDSPESGEIPPVDYSSIYRYLAQILQGDRLDDVDPLKPLECSILLDMIHSLMDVLSATDTTVQRTVMRWKCDLMDDRDETGHTVPESLRKAAENDFQEYIEEEEKKWSRNLMSKSEERPSEAGTEPDIDLENDLKRELLTPEPIVQHSTYTVEAPSFTATERTKDPDKVSITTSAGNLCTYQRSWKHKPGRKAKQAEEETPITDVVVVMPPKNVKIVNLAPRAKKPRKIRDDGKYKPVNKTVEMEKIAVETKSQVNFGESIAAGVDKTNIVEVDHSERLEKKREEEFEKLLKLYEARKRKYGQIHESAAKHAKKKPKLYTINPFCIPVSLLDLDS